MTKPTENELLALYDRVAYMPNDGQGDPLTPYGNFCAGYEARAELAEKEKAELQAKINELREAAENYVLEGESALPALEQSLAKTPPQCLQEHDNEVIERCAKVVDESYAFDSDGFAKEIRALKGKQNG